VSYVLTVAAFSGLSILDFQTYTQNTIRHELSYKQLEAKSNPLGIFQAGGLSILDFHFGFL
jgi:hypothetical protein